MKVAPLTCRHKIGYLADNEKDVRQYFGGMPHLYKIIDTKGRYQMFITSRGDVRIHEKSKKHCWGVNDVFLPNSRGFMTYNDSIPKKELESFDYSFDFSSEGEKYEGEFFDEGKYDPRPIIWDMLDRYRMKPISKYLKRRKYRKNGGTSVFSTKENIWADKAYDWGYIISYRKGDRPVFYLPKNKTTFGSVYGNKFCFLKGVELKVDNQVRFGGNSVGSFFYPSNISKFKFTNGKRDFVISYMYYPYLNGISRAVTNGRGHWIYLYDVTGIDFRKCWTDFD